MYRKLVWMPVLAFCALTAAMAGGWWTFPGGLSVAALYARLTGWLPANAAGDLRLAATFFVTGLVPVAVGLGLTWFAAFHPGRRVSAGLALLKYLAVLAVGAQLVVHMYYRASGLAAGARAVGLQAPGPLPVLLAASGLPHALLEVTAISFVLSAPLYWLFRGVRVASLQRATFEAWVEIKRLTVPALLLLAAATAIQVWAQPAITAAVLR
ncbi:MAG TPA: hypothetical protein VD969_07960 [Symbiobacteriaceae bacterium]|nr:hypothetical protein [Symbiobacteriaceae bacterium]